MDTHPNDDDVLAAWTAEVLDADVIADATQQDGADTTAGTVFQYPPGSSCMLEAETTAGNPAKSEDCPDSTAGWGRGDATADVVIDDVTAGVHEMRCMAAGV